MMYSEIPEFSNEPIDDLNVELLREIQKEILAEPKRLNMEVISVKVTDINYDPNEIPACGTIGCIAGWACMITDAKNQNNNNFIDFVYKANWIRGAMLLNIKNNNQQYNLFDVFDWPKEHRVKYMNAKTLEERAQILSDRIDLFIETKGMK